MALFIKDLTVILHASSSPAKRNPDGKMFMEPRFEGIEVNGFRLPYPNAWKRSRYLEFSYLDVDDNAGFAIALGGLGRAKFSIERCVT